MLRIYIYVTYVYMLRIYICFVYIYMLRIYIYMLRIYICYVYIYVTYSRMDQLGWNLLWTLMGSLGVTEAKQFYLNFFFLNGQRRALQLVYNVFTLVILKFWTPVGSASNGCSAKNPLKINNKHIDYNFNFYWGRCWGGGFVEGAGVWGRKKLSTRGAMQIFGYIIIIKTLRKSWHFFVRINQLEIKNILFKIMNKIERI